jgi:NADH-quinone oxidoreductase subunit N
VQFEGIASIVDQEGPISLGLLFGLVFIVAGLAFKISAVPFHMWTPDVYEGAPTPVTAFFSTAPKVAAAALLARVLMDAFGGAVADWQQIVAFLSLASMFLGAVAAIGQRNIKRLMAYSSITHMGFVLMGLAAGSVQGAQAMLIYLAIYVVMNVGVFAFILNMEKDGKPVTDIGALGLYSRQEPARAAALAVLMFSLAGVPPLVGFFGKFYVLVAAVEAGLVWLAVAGVVAAVIAAFYYLRIVYLMYFAEPVEALDGRMPLLHGTLLGGSALLMVLGVVNLFGIDGVAANAAATLVR